MDVGVRDLRNSLSRHLAAVRHGATVTVTDHGKPVARLMPVDEDSPLERLVREGLVTPARSPKKPAPEPLSIDTTLSDLADQQRR